MSSRPELVVDWCSHAAAKYAVEHWHYSGSMPTPPVMRLGVWEGGEFRGCVLFSRGSSTNLHKPYKLQMIEVCELTRVALRSHNAPVSKMLSVAVSKLKARERGLRLIVSFADPEQKHLGGIYQASNWIYSGQSSDYDKFMDESGRVWHPRQVSKNGHKWQYGEYRAVPKIDDCERIRVKGKHRYLYPLDRSMRRQIQSLAQPYPKRETCGHSSNGGAPDDQSEGPGSIPGVRSDLVSSLT